MSTHRKISRRARDTRAVRRATPRVEPCEARIILTGAAGLPPTVASILETISGASSTIAVTFSGPMNAAAAGDPAFYRLGLAGPDGRFGAADAHPLALRSVVYDPSTLTATLTPAQPLRLGVFYQVFINGMPPMALTGADGTLFDGDVDQTAGGDFRRLIGLGKSLRFVDMEGDVAGVGITGPGQVEIVRLVNGDVQILTVLCAVGGLTSLIGHAQLSPTGVKQVTIPVIDGLDGGRNLLPTDVFGTIAPNPAGRTPVVAPPGFKFSVEVVPVSPPSALSLQSAVSAQDDGKWLLFGGRTNGLHNFDPFPGLTNFPPKHQNQNIIVIDPKTGQTWTRSRASTGLPASVTDSRVSTNQEHYQRGDRLYTIGGYGVQTGSGQFTTFDTLTSISVSGLINAVVTGGDVASQVRQVQDPRLRVTGGEIAPIGHRSILVFGQDFEGGYNPGNSGFTQIYANEIKSFHIVDNSRGFSITNYATQIDPTDLRRRDYSLSPSVEPDGTPSLIGFGRVFTPAGNASRNPVRIGPRGHGKVDVNYQQYFSQYDTAHVPMFDGLYGSALTLFLGGISLYDYDPATGTLSQDSMLPFVNDVTTYVRSANGSSQEYIMPARLPGLLGAEAAFFTADGVPTTSNGVVRLAKLEGPTVVGYMYGGIESTVPNTTNPETQTTASSKVFAVVVTPSGS